MEKISIIVPIYNGEKYIKRCLDSLINQSYKNIEIVLINDGSNDNSLKIMKEYSEADKRIVVIDKKNTGVSDTRNLGIKRASGEYICFCDCDDMYDINYIDIMYKTIKKHNVDILKCNYKVIDEDNNHIGNGDVTSICNKKLNKKDLKNIIIPKCLEGDIPCFSYLLMIKKDKLNVKYPTDISMMEDVLFYIRLLLNVGSMYIIDDELYTIMFNTEGATNNVNNYKRNILNVIDVNYYIKNELKQYNLLTNDNVNKLNTNNLNAISDFIFKHFLYGKGTIKLCKEIRTTKFIDIINNNLNNINLQRKLILVFIKNKLYFLLWIYFIIRRIIFKLKRKK